MPSYAQQRLCSRWPIAQCYEDAKGACGLDDSQGRRWERLHRQVLLWLFQDVVSWLMATNPIAPCRPRRIWTKSY